MSVSFPLIDFVVLPIAKVELREVTRFVFELVVVVLVVEVVVVEIVEVV